MVRSVRTVITDPLETSLNYFPSQTCLARATFPIKLKSQRTIVLSPPMVEPITSIPSSATNSRMNELANFLPPNCIVPYCTSPIPPVGIGIPRGPMTESYFDKYSAPNSSSY
jgi:hypothetical protein